MSTLHRSPPEPGDPPRTVDNFLGSLSIASAAIAEWLEGHLGRSLDDPLTLPQLKLLKLVALTEGQSVRDVAMVMGVSRAAASKGVDRLVRRGLLRRSEDERDRRSIRISLTDSGIRLLESYDASREQALEELFRDFSEEDLRAAASFLDRVSVGLVSRSEDPTEACLRCNIYFREKCLLRSLVGRRCLYQRRASGAGSARDEGRSESRPEPQTRGTS